MATNGVDEIICPYCKHQHDHEEYLEVGDMSGEFDMECEGCGKEFHVDFFSVYHIEAFKKEGE